MNSNLKRLGISETLYWTIMYIVYTHVYQVYQLISVKILMLCHTGSHPRREIPAPATKHTYTSYLIEGGC